MRKVEIGWIAKMAKMIGQRTERSKIPFQKKTGKKRTAEKERIGKKLESKGRRNSALKMELLNIT